MALRPDNYFTLLQLPVSFAVNAKRLEEHYRKLQHNMHPDRFADQGENERQTAIHYSALINDAYRTLKEPLKRALYLLQCHGMTLDEATTAADPELLQEQMTLRQRLAENDDVVSVGKQVASRLQEIESGLHDLFSAAAPDEPRLKREIVRLQFFTKLAQELRRQNLSHTVGNSHTREETI